MHELSVCQALLEQVEDLARRHGVAEVQRIVVQIGPLSGVDPALLSEAFAVSRRGCTTSTKLDLEEAPVRVRCLECGSESAASANRLLCAACGTYRTRLLSGEELLLRRVEFPLLPARESPDVH